MNVARIELYRRLVADDGPYERYRTRVRAVILAVNEHSEPYLAAYLAVLLFDIKGKERGFLLFIGGASPFPRPPKPVLSLSRDDGRKRDGRNCYDQQHI